MRLKKVAGVLWSDSNQVEQIKYKVDDDIRRIISRCCSMDEVWDVLDLEFAQEQEVINAVDQELTKPLPNFTFSGKTIDYPEFK